MNALANPCKDAIFFPEVLPTDRFSEDPWIQHFNQATPDFFSSSGTEPLQVDLRRYRLTVGGVVSRTSQFSVDDLRFNFPEYQVTVRTPRDDLSGRSREESWQ